MSEYLTKEGPKPLPPHVADKMFESYLAGSSLAEVGRSYPEFSPNAIMYTAWHYNWGAMRDDLFLDLQERVKQKVLYSKFQQLELVGNMISVAHVQANQAMQAYIKNPTERNLPKALRINTIKDLALAIEMMSQIIGQDQHKSISVSGNISTGQTPPGQSLGQGAIAGALSDATANELIKALNRKKRKVEAIAPTEVIEGVVEK